MWSKFMRDSYLSRAPPPTGTVDFQKIEDAAREKLKDRQDAFLYVFGNAGTGESFHDNRKELSKWKVIPRQLRDATHRSIETTIFGQKYSSPLFLAPVGVQGIVHRDAELAVRCRICPLPDINLPDGWELAPPEDAWLYQGMIAQDANFRLKNRIRHSSHKDPWLGPGMAYFVADEPYRDFIVKHAAKPDDRCVSSVVVGRAMRWERDDRENVMDIKLSSSSLAPATGRPSGRPQKDPSA
ncbi:hypothetical protein NUW54_g11649 [Trametes sanguinea]|uniref:Uncharacterized protein n=1 Tax=Trametes sanguinea TaxID=158606 RepID=A0ACC1NBX3_9APHY|nr:hypothetical protein NUW54_g11649 [Trametes sanguinea]